MTSMKRFCSIIFFSLLLFGCREEYISPVITPDLGYLVVEGVINSGTGNNYPGPLNLQMGKEK